MSIRVSSLCALLVAVVLTPGPSAQVTGTVHNAAGTPLEGATVEAWGESGRLANRISGAGGRFAFSPFVGQATTRVIVALIGYRTTVVRTEPPHTPLSITLEIQPLPLPELIVAATQSVCPAPDGDQARELWERASSRYADETLQLAGTAVVYEATGEVTEAAVGQIDEAQMQQVGRVWRGADWPPGPWGRNNIDEISKRDGYVSRARDGRLEYPNLAGVDASHFASAAFGDLHNFVVVTQTEEATVLQFCPNSDFEGTISGTMHLTTTGQLLEARWIFDSADLTQEAGGEVFFGEYVDAESDAIHLVSGRGAFWRHTPGERRDDRSRSFWQLLQVFNDLQLMEDKRGPRDGESH